MKEKIKKILAKLDPSRGPKEKLKSAIKKLIIANLAAGAAGGALGTLGASYLMKDKKKDK